MQVLTWLTYSWCWSGMKGIFPELSVEYRLGNGVLSERQKHETDKTSDF